jgi:hypothetical protein
MIYLNNIYCLTHRKVRIAFFLTKGVCVWWCVRMQVLLVRVWVLR